MEMYTWCRTCLSTGCIPVESVPGRLVYSLHRLEVCSCRECWHQPASRASASTGPQSGIGCRLLCAMAVSHWARSRGSWRLICLGSNCSPHGTVVAFCDFSAVYKCHDLLTYLINIIYTPLCTVQQIYYIHNVVQMQLISYIHNTFY